MVSSLLLGVAYAASLIVWLREVALKSPAAWSWWVIVAPIALLVGFTVFFLAWIGWVMVSASPSRREELLKGP